ncbi:MAG: protein kinase domain-containing protein [Kofleriaceae bacterium]
MECPDAESIAELVSERSDGELRAAFVTHAASCEGCHAVIDVLFDLDRSETREFPEAIGRYRVRRQLGAGGMGVVYVAHDPELDREVAIKMLKAGANAARLKREGQALAKLSHPNVVAVHDVGEHDGHMFVAMALVHGENLRAWLKAKHTRREILAVLCSAGGGIVAAHTAGLIHRDLKPDNIFIAKTGEVLVGDFGLAREAGEESGAASDVSCLDTMTGTVLGTPAYMAPEQAEGRATEKSDQFSFCVMAYEALLGTRPFSGATFSDLQANVRSGKIATRGALDTRVEKALVRGLRADPDERFPSMRELLAAIEPRSRRWPFVAAGAVVAGAAVVTTVLVTRQPAVDPDAACATAGTPAWNALTRGAVEAALRAQGNTPDAIVEIGRRLDHYAATWTTARRDTCMAQVTGRLAPAQATARIACLEMRRTAFEITADSLLATATDVFATWRRVSLIPSPSSCNTDDAMRLSAGGSEQQALMRELATAVNTDAKALADVARKAESSADIPARLEIALAQARSALDDTKPREADAALERARPLAEQLDVATLRVRAFALSARSLCIQARAAEAERFLALALAGGERLRETENAAELDEVFAARAECLYRRKQYADVAPLLEQQLVKIQRRYGHGGLEEVELHQRLALVYLQLERPEDSAREYAAGRTIEAKLLRVDEAAAAEEEGLSVAALQAGDLESAIVHGRRQIDLIRRLRPVDLGPALTSLGMLVAFSQEPRLADAMFTEALSLIPADTPDEAQAVKRVETLDLRGLARLEAGDADAAIVDVEAAIVGAQKYKRTDYEVSAQLTLGRAWFAKREYARAVRVLRPALEAYKASEAFTTVRSTVAEFEYVQALWETGDQSTARALAPAAETGAAKLVEGSTESALFRHLEPSSRALLASVERWRDTHR